MENQHVTQAIAEKEICADEHRMHDKFTPLEISGCQELPDNKAAKHKEMADKVPYYKLFSFADPLDHVLMLFGTITAVGTGICVPLLAVLFGEIINSFGEARNTEKVVQEVSKVSLKFVFLAIGSGAASFSQVACWMVTGERQAARIRSLYLRALLMQDIAFFDMETSTGEIIERISSDTILIQDVMGEKVGKFIQLSSAFLGGFVIAFIKGWLLTLVLITSIPPLILTSSAMTFVLAKLASRAQAAYSVAASVVEQNLTFIRTVASFTGEKQAIAEYDKSLIKAYKAGVQEGLAAGLSSGVFMFVFFCSYGLGIWFGSKMISEKRYSGGDVLIVSLAILTGSFSIGQASPCLSAFASGQAAAFKMFQIMNRKSDINSHHADGLKLDDIDGIIELKDVHFCYPARPEAEIFVGFSLLIPRGTTVALVGRSGSGKSTVISLVERFYDPQAGEVLIDGINIKEFQLRWIRSKIGLVIQEPMLFSSSIRDNIAFGKDNVSLEDIKAAAELANAVKFINKLPQKLYEDAVQVVSDAVETIRTVASFSAEDNVIQLYEKKCQGLVKAGIKRGMCSGIGYGFSKFFLHLAYATIFYAGAQFVKAGQITFVEVFQVFYGLSLAGIAISQSSALSPDSSRRRSGAASILAILDQKSKINSSENTGIILENVKGDILFQQVSFRYPSRPGIEIFKDLCLRIESGKTVALVGESGSGKSTVISLLQRFYDPDSGEITLDGVELRRLNLKWLRHQMGLVSQEPILFSSTIRSNIAYGKEGSATEAEIIAAAEIANAHKFISALPQGYDTPVGERGIQLSGGQKQRVAIARAIVKCPKILLLDEATSALDAESERLVQDALDQAMVEKTTLVVAHRISTIKRADLIVVVKNGVIEEKENHEKWSD